MEPQIPTLDHFGKKFLLGIGKRPPPRVIQSNQPSSPNKQDAKIKGLNPKGYANNYDQEQKLIKGDIYWFQSRVWLLIALISIFGYDQDVKREALVIGIGDYAPATRNDLNGIERDVSKIKRLFKSLGFKVTILYDAQAMKILEYLDRYSEILDSNDYFAFYYSGHGSYEPDESLR